MLAYTVTVAVPGFCPVTTPLLSTIKIESFEDSQVYVTFFTSAGSIDAVKVIFLKTVTESLPLIATLVISLSAVTVTFQVSEYLLPPK